MTGPNSTNARWFNGRDRRPRMALVRIHGQHLELVPHLSESAGLSAPLDGSARRYARKLLKVGERWRGTPVPVLLPDGGTVLLSADSAVAKALAPQGQAVRLMGRWSGVAASLLLLILLAAWAATALSAYGWAGWVAVAGAVLGTG